MLCQAGLRIADYLTVYLNMYFGWQGAPLQLGCNFLTADAVLRITHSMERKHGPGSFEAFQFVDDGGFAEPARASDHG